MNKYVTPACFLLYILTFLNFFLIGGLFVKITGAAEGQGMAAGAMVFTYGLVFASLALITSLIIVSQANPKFISKTNKLLGIGLFLIILYMTFSFYNSANIQ
ncbi:MAG: hypothetical protein H7X99_04205 [Saprospiraceae bacterium]|nr:hypothetical protein [Saprospiraceae bacterium]